VRGEKARMQGYYPPRFTDATRTSAIRKVFILFYTLHHAGFAFSFISPTIGVQLVVRQNTITGRARDRCMEDTQHLIARKSSLFKHRVNRPKSSILLSEKKTNIEIDKQQEEEESRSFSVLKSLGNKVMSTIRRSNETIAEENLNDESEDEAKQKGWFTRASKEPDSGEVQDDVDGKTSGIFGLVNTFKLRRQSNNMDIKERESSTESNLEPRAVSPFRKPNIADPFESELALASELRKQKALDRYVSGETEQIPLEFLPQTSEDGSLGINQALNTLDNSVSFIRGKMKEIRLNKSDEDNKFFLTPTEEEKRLDKIRKDLENRRKQLLIEEQNRKNKKTIKDGERKEKLITTETPKRGKSAKSTSIEKTLEVKSNDTIRVNEIQKAWPGVIVDGVVSGAASAIGNTWQLIRSTATKSSDEEWIPVCPKTRVSPGEIYPVVAGGLDLLVIGSKDGTKVFCVPNSCPHLGTPLETGMVERRPCPKPYGPKKISNSLSTNDDTKMAVDDGFEECIVCPLHRTAFSLDTGEVRGEWCPYPPVIGKIMGTVKAQNNLTTFKMRTRGKYLEIKITSELDNES
jgi:nitrite reductase/ring-hydroxylating ferredoxin subunit